MIDGIDVLEPDVLGRAVEAELAGRLASMERPAWGAGVAVDRLRAAADIGMVGPGRSSAIGSRIAASVHGAVVSALSEEGRDARPSPGSGGTSDGGSGTRA